MTDVSNKQQTIAFSLSTRVTLTTRHTELTKKPDNPEGKPALYQRTFSSVFHAGFLHSQTAQFNLKCMGHFTNSIVSPAVPLSQQVSSVVISAPHTNAEKLRM
jgi:hypothetical protein